MGTLAIITARGGSKRIPRKNIKEFCGQPIIKYSIDAALNSRLFDEVIVSTDDEEIANLSKKFGAKVPFYRSSLTSGDYSTTADVIYEVLDEYKKVGKTFTYVCCIYPTAPFVTATELKKAMLELISNNADSLVPVVAFSFPPQRGVVIIDNRLYMKWPENMNARSQDLEKIYHDCGQFYLLKTDVFLKNSKLITDNTLAFIVPEIQMQDIDTEEDWVLAELKYKYLNSL